MEAKRILVTGGAGFLGSELTRQLAKKRLRFTVVDNLVNGKRDNIDEVLGEDVELVVGDVRDGALMADLMGGVDVVYHLACLGVRHSIHSPQENHEVNAAATLRLLLEARNAGVRRFVYVSSSEVYGPARTVPMDEEHPTFPMTVYGAAKLAGECYTRAFHRTYGFETVVVRPFNAYGPRCHHEGDCGEVIPKFMLRCLAGQPLIVFGDGTQTRDFTYASDIAGGIIAAGLSDAAVGETINLGSAVEISVNDLAREVMDVVGGSDAEVIHQAPRPGDVLRLHADSRRASRLLDFRPSVNLRDGLTRLKDWYLAGDRSPEELLERETVHNWEPCAGGIPVG